MAKISERAGLDDPALPDDADPVAESLDLREDVAGQQHRPARSRKSFTQTWKWTP